ncbi:MAG TPA: S8 family serine peptidase, partial [Thermoanaerobaculia bacterium]|nr:S8 family serine peptidase [Thermoanaerobaculia bacterium]
MMLRFTLIPRSILVVVTAVAVALAVPALASADSYVLTAGKWGQKQNDAVAAAGGTVVWSHGKTGIAVVTSDDPGFADAAQASNAFQTATLDFEVQWIDPDAEPQVITPGDETFFPLQWNMQAIEAPAAWATGCTGAGARVAILDGGIYDVHADLEPNLDKGCSASFVPGQAYNTDTGTFWHGTHVAGIVGAADNGFGVIGVAPEATLIGVKVLHSGSGSFGGVIGGILYASDPASFGRPDCAKADIINMSLGAAFFKNQPGAGPLVGAMAQAVNFAASQGVLVISAAGNNGVDVRDFPALTFVPADSGSGLAVSATGPVDFANGGTDFRRPASYSNFGDGFIDVAAPGGDFTLFPVGLWFQDMVLSTCRGASAPPNFSFCFAAGTSMASPAAAGVAALIKSTNPGISLGALKSKLRNTADDEGEAGTDSFYG